MYVYFPHFTDKKTKAWREAKSLNWDLSLLAASKDKSQDLNQQSHVIAQTLAEKNVSLR